MSAHESGTSGSFLSSDSNADVQGGRRRFLRAGAAAAAGWLAGIDRTFGALSPGPLAGGNFAGIVPFHDEQVAPASTLISSELDGRSYTDLSRISAGQRITPNADFFVRTAASKLLPGAAGWKIALGGLVEHPTEISVAALRKSARPMGTHLLECAGNVALTRFGLISAASWTGVPVIDVLGEAKRSPGAARVEIAGFDEYSSPSHTSVPGASWIFSIEALNRAFLATEMNGRPLSPNHGAPVRLVVPGWYGAACIKWVNRITFVAEDAESSSQMIEYAVRTLQDGRPQLARDYAPATVDAAALPVRLEKWVVAGKLNYRIVGIVWGGSQPSSSLQIRFNPDEAFVAVPGFRQVNTDPWTVWTHRWSPAAPGDYTIRLALDPSIPARKLNLGLYDRTVHIGEI